jgi:hypothetical protein
MCKSFDVSLFTGIYSYAIAYYLYRRNIRLDRAAAIILVAFSTIQWLEAFLWYDLTNPSLNRFITALIPIVLGLEFVATLYAASLHSTVSTLEILIYGLSFVGLTIMWWKNSTGITTIDPKTGSLLWGGIGIDPIMRFVFLALLLYPLFRFIPSSISMTLIAIVTTFFFFYSFKFGDTFGSNWCWIANLVALIQLFAPFLDFGRF